MAAASEGPTPATRVSSCTEALLTSTPTVFTQLSTTPLSVRRSAAASTSC